MDMAHESERTNGNDPIGLAAGLGRAEASGCDARMLPALASARAIKLRAEQRLRAIRTLWDEPEHYDRIVASGRYLKLCALLQFASEAVDRASERLDREIQQDTTAHERVRS